MLAADTTKPVGRFEACLKTFDEYIQAAVRVLPFIIVLFLSVSLLFIIVGLGLDKWQEVGVPTSIVELGLFKTCSIVRTANTTSGCNTFDLSTFVSSYCGRSNGVYDQRVQTVRAMVILGLIFTFFALLSHGKAIHAPPRQLAQQAGVVAVTVLAFVFTGCGVIVYLDTFDDWMFCNHSFCAMIDEVDETTPCYDIRQASFGLILVALCFKFFAGILTVLSVWSLPLGDEEEKSLAEDAGGQEVRAATKAPANANTTTTVGQSVSPAREQSPSPKKDIKDRCQKCNKKFAFYRRRHHCRKCGDILCHACSATKIKVAGFGDDPVRVCKDCNQPPSPQSSASNESVPQQPVVVGATPPRRQSIQPMHIGAPSGDQHNAADAGHGGGGHETTYLQINPPQRIDEHTTYSQRY